MDVLEKAESILRQLKPTTSFYENVHKKWVKFDVAAALLADCLQLPSIPAARAALYGMWDQGLLIEMRDGEEWVTWPEDL